jgi:parvulin-like peptidyl-prolyl isomerase
MRVAGVEERAGSRGLWWVVGGLMLLAAPACGGLSEPGRKVVAVVDGEEVHLSELEAYFEIHLPSRALDQEGPDRDEVLSRLFDRFIDERILLREARRRGFEATDEDVRAYLGASVEEGEERSQEPVGAGRLEAVRRTLIVQKLRGAHLRERVRVTPEMVAAHLERERVAPARSLVLRSLLVGSPELGRRIRQRIAEGRMSFDDAVARHAAAPGQGVRLETSLDGLPPEVRAAIAGLAPGQVSEAVELHGSTVLFQVVSWKPGEAVGEDAIRAQAEEELLRELGRQALEELEAELRAKAHLTIRNRNLPFRYVS